MNKLEFIFPVSGGAVEITHDMVKRAGLFSYDIRDDFYSLVIPEGVEIIGKNAFAFLNIRSVTLPKSLKAIGEKAFFSCSALKSVELPENLEELGDGAFLDCYGLKTINIPHKIKSIPQNCFNGCRDLASVKFEGRIESIGDSAFSGCSVREIPKYKDEDILLMLEEEYPDELD